MINKTKYSLVTGLTALSTAIICQTSMSYASDIEIYKAPTTGGSTITLILDLSSSMYQGTLPGSSTNQTPVNKDFFNGKNCTIDETSFQISTLIGGASKSFVGRYCYIEDKQKYKADGSVINNTREGVYKDLPTKDRNAISIGCIARDFTETIKSSTDFKKVTRYYCPDRLTTLKKSLFELIAGNSKVIVPLGNPVETTITALPDTTTLGITTFNGSVTTRGIYKLDTQRAALLDVIKGLAAGSGTAISNAMAEGAKQLSDHIQSSTEVCAGYGLYFLTDGEPYNDNRKAAKTTFAKLVKDKSTSDKVPAITSRCTDGTTMDSSDDRLRTWECTTDMAKILNQGYTLKGNQIKTAVVGFGNEFRFADNSGNRVVYLSTNPDDPDDKHHPMNYYNDTLLASLFNGTNNRVLQAAKASVQGGGGWYSPDNAEEITNSVQEFVKSIKVPIPAITTGTAAIPQDRLNPIAIQSYAYFPQFQPKPSEDFEAWFGNLKKFKVQDGILVGQSNAKVFGKDGALNTTTSDLWVKGAATDLAGYGGLLSKLNLQTLTNSTDFARTVFTNAGGSIQKVNLQYLQDKIATGNNKYLLGALGYDLTEHELTQLAALSKIELRDLIGKKQNRSIGAVMHSTPVLLTQSGKITYSDVKKSNETVDRDDYILFGTTQGALHIVKTGREAETYATGVIPPNYEGGKEIFTFIPEEILAKQPKALLSESNTEGNGMDELYYGIDGAWTAHTEYVYSTAADKFEVNPLSGKKGKQWVYGGMRMGGSSYYALDLTDIHHPQIKFRIDPESGKVYKKNDTSGTAYNDLTKMGQSWSKPTIAYVQWKGQRKLVMLVGGGYDPQYEDFKSSNATKGAGVYMFDADTGDLLWSTYDASGEDKAHLKYSVVSQIKAVDREGDGDIDHLYFGDLGGQVFRIDLKSAHASSESKTDFAKITRLADFKKTGKYAPRFYEMPAFSIYRNSTGMFAVVSIGSGNRSTPLLGKVIDSKYVVNGETESENSNLLNDAIYNIYDLAVTDANPAASNKGPLSIGRDNLYKLVDTDRELALNKKAGEVHNEHSNYKGWYYEFTSSASVANRKAVEKVQSDLILLDSDLYVSTFDAEGVGSTEACGAGIYGSSRAHRFCMPYGQCGAGDAVANNTMTLGKGLLGITLGQSQSAQGLPYYSLVGPVESRDVSTNKILNTLYRNTIKLTPYSWYERN
ncbi:hypothetical protein G9F31_03885 [Acinetobacter sp. 187]|uniref:pilus assembly protein n=1 Tax=Acinetobacter lanii TaxID=2715163 RepID=UPI00140AA5D8|nr:PilC/PilY family type IV pilus protein [Acinetobacter lanii]NHC02911.1 hypothetical protein [Acinetobacter lanii]